MKSPPTTPASECRRGRHRQALLTLGIAAIALIGWRLWLTDTPSETASINNPHVSERRRTVAENWQWQPTVGAAQQPDFAASPVERISPAAVVRALGRVEFDANGKVIADRNARNVLEDSLEAFSNLTDEELEALQETLRTGLPGAKGERVAKIVTDFYRYRAAAQALDRSTEAPTHPEGERTQLNQLAKLRDDYLGTVVARQFYAEDQALQRYMLENQGGRATDSAALRKDLRDGVFYLDSRSSADARELSLQMNQLRTQGASDEQLHYIQTQQLGLYTANALPRSEAEQSDWQQRYARFKQERQRVLTAGLAEQDKQAQIEQLLGQHFNADELEAIRVYDAQ